MTSPNIVYFKLNWSQSCYWSTLYRHNGNKKKDIDWRERRPQLSIWIWVPDMLHAGAWREQANLSAVWSQLKTLEGLGSLRRQCRPLYTAEEMHFKDFLICRLLRWGNNLGWPVTQYTVIKMPTSSISVEATCVCYAQYGTWAIVGGFSHVRYMSFSHVTDLQKIPEYNGEPAHGSI